MITGTNTGRTRRNRLSGPDNLQGMALRSRDAQDFWERYRASGAWDLWRRNPPEAIRDLDRLWRTGGTNEEEHEVTTQREEATAEEMWAIVDDIVPLRDLTTTGVRQVRTLRTVRFGTDNAARAWPQPVPSFRDELEQDGYGINYS